MEKLGLAPETPNETVPPNAPFIFMGIPVARE
jgi:hypothetical protein